MWNILLPVLGSLLVGIGCWRWGVYEGQKGACEFHAHAIERLFRYLEFQEPQCQAMRGMLIVCQKEVRMEQVLKKPIPLNSRMVAFIHPDRTTADGRTPKEGTGKE